MPCFHRISVSDGEITDKLESIRQRNGHGIIPCISANRKKDCAIRGVEICGVIVSGRGRDLDGYGPARIRHTKKDGYGAVQQFGDKRIGDISTRLIFGARFGDDEYRVSAQGRGNCGLNGPVDRKTNYCNGENRLHGFVRFHFHRVLISYKEISSYKVQLKMEKPKRIPVTISRFNLLIIRI